MCYVFGWERIDFGSIAQIVMRVDRIFAACLESMQMICIFEIVSKYLTGIFLLFGLFIISSEHFTRAHVKNPDMHNHSMHEVEYFPSLLSIFFLYMNRVVVIVYHLKKDLASHEFRTVDVFYGK